VAGREWPLVFFTLLGQLAVGAYLFVLLPLFFNRPVKPEGGDRDLRLAVVLVVLGLLATAALISFFHLGNPGQAPNALNNLKRSWLSREILFELATLCLLSLLALFLILRVGNAALVQVTALAAAATGLLFLLSMARVYLLPTAKPWNTFFTPASFFLTAFLLGAAAAAATSFLFKTPPSSGRALIILSIALAAIGLILSVSAAPHFGLWGYRPAAGLKPPGSPSLILFAGRIALLLSGAILLALQAKKVTASFSAPARLSTLAAFCFFLAAEIAGRFLFYGFYLGKR
jgi:DMSO reductase anchor subunit